jgi:hypothetical protein
MDHLITTEYAFTLPIGFRDTEGTLHRNGVIRLATAGDEIFAMRDSRVQANPAYLPLILIARTVKLGALEEMSPAVVEALFVSDFAYLQKLYNTVNRIDDDGMSSESMPDFGGEAAGNVEALPSQASFMKR